MSMWLAVRPNKSSAYVAHEITDTDITFGVLNHRLSNVNETDVVANVN